MFYATNDADGSCIRQNATIRAFDTEDEARAYLLGGYDAADWNLGTAVIGAGDYGDCWIKVHSEPTNDGDQLIAGLCEFEPFAAGQLIVRRSGQHPGGRAWWITPSPSVMVVEHIEEM
jgi:hypothetical protein